MHIAFNAIEFVAEKLPSAFFRNYPGPYGPGWVVTDMAGVSAIEVCHPITVFVLMKVDNALFHLHSFGLRVLPRLPIVARQ